MQAYKTSASMFTWLIITVGLLLSGTAHAEEDNAGVPQLPSSWLCPSSHTFDHQVLQTCRLAWPAGYSIVSS